VGEVEVGAVLAGEVDAAGDPAVGPLVVEEREQRAARACGVGQPAQLARVAPRAVRDRAVEVLDAFRARGMAVRPGGVDEVEPQTVPAVGEVVLEVRVRAGERGRAAKEAAPRVAARGGVRRAGGAARFARGAGGGARIGTGARGPGRPASAG